MSLASVIYIHAVQIERVLKARHSCDKELLAVLPPERYTEILVFLRIKISPYYLRFEMIASVRLYICLKIET